MEKNDGHIEKNKININNIFSNDFLLNSLSPLLKNGDIKNNIIYVLTNHLFPVQKGIIDLIKSLILKGVLFTNIIKK